jgi:ABC-type phosphate transport system auxiliary subunit
MFGSSVSSITKGLSKMASRLEAHRQAMDGKVDRTKADIEAENHRHQQALDTHQQAINAAVSERDRAEAVAGKIRALIE